MKKIPLSVDAFNRELDRVVNRGSVSGEELIAEDQQALKLAQRLAFTDFSRNSTIRQTLRHRLGERATRQLVRSVSFRQINILRDVRAVAGAGIAMLLAVIWVFGLLTPHNISATPAYVTFAASPDFSGKPLASLTVSVSQNREFMPKPAPTPMTITTSVLQSPLLPEGTPAHTNLPLGSQFPIVTTIVSK